MIISMEIKHEASSNNCKDVFTDCLWIFFCKHLELTTTFLHGSIFKVENTSGCEQCLDTAWASTANTAARYSVHLINELES